MFRGKLSVTVSGPKYINPQLLDRLYHEAGPDAAGACADPLYRAVRADMPYLLEVGIPDALRFIVGVADVVPDVGRLAAEFANSAHDSSFLSAILRANIAL